MSAGARDQVARLLTLVPWLHRTGEVHLEDAAATLGTTREQLLADLKVLLMCGLPGGYPDDLIDVDLDALEDGGDGVVRIGNADYLARPLRLSATEASALVVALRAVRAGADAQTLEVVDRTLAKLEAAAAEGSAPAVLLDEEGGDDALDPTLAPRLADAAARGRQVRLTYWTPSRDEVSERTVDPRGVVRHGGHAYLDAWCHAAEAPRLFRLDRVRDAVVLDEPVVSERAAPRDLEAEGLFATSPEAPTATLRLAPGAHWVPEYYPVDAVRPQDDGTLEVDLVVADPRWLDRLVLRLAPHARVVGPAEFTHSSTAAAAETLGLYG